MTVDIKSFIESELSRLDAEQAETFLSGPLSADNRNRLLSRIVDNSLFRLGRESLEGSTKELHQLLKTTLTAMDYLKQATGGTEEQKYKDIASQFTKEQISAWSGALEEDD